MPDDPHVPHLLVRADGGPRIGMGHVVRSLALAGAWRAAGGNVTWLGEVAETGAQFRIRQAGIDLLGMEGTAGSERDLQMTRKIATELGNARGTSPWIVLDGYALGPRYQESLREAGSRVMVIDDTAHHERYPADVVLNQNPGAEALEYPSGPATVLLLGPRYALLRREVLEARRDNVDTAASARRVLITMGGADPVDATSKVLEALRGVKEAEVVVVVGPANPRFEELRRAAGQLPSPPRVERDPADLPALMADAEMAITAGGSTCLELAYLGVPSLVVQLAENQTPGARSLAEAGAAVDAGWHADLTPEALAVMVEVLRTDEHRRAQMSAAGRRLVDGRGAERVVAALQALHGGVGAPAFTLRRAAWEDRFALWRLANEPLLRANSFDRPEIPLDRHLEWLREKLADHGSLLLVMDLAGVVAAQVRYDRREPEIAEVHFAVAPAFRGRRLGVRALADSWRMAAAELGVRRVQGVVLQGNEPSARAFRAAGYHQVREGEMRGFPCHVFELNCESM